uniref:Uncharacterized protein n=1 Tax=Arundo donax TaxID=35708 RepID=A0A0A9THK9_ARUDO
MQSGATCYDYNSTSIRGGLGTIWEAAVANLKVIL